MPFITITKPATGAATRKSLIDDVIDNQVFLNAEVSAGKTVKQGVNGAFELDSDSDGTPDGYVATDYSGGSHVLSTTAHISGFQSISFTSTVLANGGGDLEDKDFQICEGGETFPWKLWTRASVVNISSRFEVEWFDEDQASLSTTIIFTDTNTPTTLTRQNGSVTAPSTARYMKRKLIGGVPATGTATGIVYFDNLMSIEIPPIAEGNIASAAVNQTALKTTTASGSTSISLSSSVSISLTGGTYSWVTFSAAASPGDIGLGNSNTAAGVWGFSNGPNSNGTIYRDERYIQASPPYRHGPLFIFLIINSDGSISSIDVSPDPHWAYHGPTDIRPQFLHAGKGYRIEKTTSGVLLADALKDPVKLKSHLNGDLVIDETEIEIDLAYKDRDMAIIPHPFTGVKLSAGQTIVMLEPGTTLMVKLMEMINDDHARTVRNLFLDNYFRISNTDLNINNTPQGVMVVRPTWK